ncbi:SWI/SNF and RSC complex subunit Ssr2 [Microbotryomycetes sp. JL201]|nr:SWI/SNF and RSC complex subunit Ssr2 [Microbotryomycetes sp. JL201]
MDVSVDGAATTSVKRPHDEVDNASASAAESKQARVDQAVPSTSAARSSPPDAATDLGIGGDAGNKQTVGPPAPAHETDDAAVARRLTTARRYLAKQTQPVVIPSYSTWFDLSTIHQIERRSLPEFFNSRNRSKTPSVYKDYRDFMIHTYRINPSEYLTVTACRRNLAGDVCAIMRVHAFLEQWGLINYQIDVDTRPAPMGPPFTGHFRILVDSPRGLAPFLHPGTQKSTSSATTPNSANPLLRRDTIQTSSSQPGKPDVRLSSDAATAIAQASLDDAKNGATADEDDSSVVIKPCSICKTTTSTTVYTTLNKQKSDVVLCPTCYSEGRFPSSLHSGDFVRLDMSSAYQHSSDSSTWTDQETLLLLEGIEMFDDDWDSVSLHVGTRTKDQCIVKFLQLPIEDPFLESTQKELGPLRYNKVPFSKEDNPVLSVVGFLAEVVSKEVAAAAAGKSIKELEQKLKEQTKSATKDAVDDRRQDANATADGDVSMTSENGHERDVDAKVETKDDQERQAAKSNIEKAAVTALGSAAAKAHILALEEDATLHTLVTSIVEAQVKKLGLKLEHFERLEGLLEVERRGIEQQKQELMKDRIKVNKLISDAQAMYHKLANASASAASTAAAAATLSVPNHNNGTNIGSDAAARALDATGVSVQDFQALIDQTNVGASRVGQRVVEDDISVHVPGLDGHFARLG